MPTSAERRRPRRRLGQDRPRRPVRRRRFGALALSLGMALALAVAAGVGAAGAGFVGDNDVDVAVEITPLPSATGFEVPDDVSPSATASAPPSASASGPTTTAGPSGARTSLGATPSGAGEDQIGYTGSDAGKLAALAVAAVALGALLFHWARRRLKDRWANGTPVG